MLYHESQNTSRQIENYDENLNKFNYCPLTWMFNNRNLNNIINKLHEKALRLAYDDDSSSFEELLNLDNSMTVHHRDLPRLATEMYKI